MKWSTAASLLHHCNTGWIGLRGLGIDLKGLDARFKRKPKLMCVPPPSTRDKLFRAIWRISWAVLFRPSPTPLHSWRRVLLRLFGATIGHGVRIYPACRIWAPWNLTVGAGATIGPATLYNVAEMVICGNAIISQGAHLCTASHNFDSPTFDLIKGPIYIGENAWVAADAFVGPGVNIGESAVISARAVVVRHVDPRDVMAGNPARTVRHRHEVGRNRLN